MIRTVSVPNATLRYGRVFTFPQMELAHHWCTGHGIELGAAAHNPFGLPNSINVAPLDGDRADFKFYQSEQVALCGAYAVIDFHGYASMLPQDDHSLKYIISSHVLEHETNLLKALKEFDRVLVEGGVVFTIVPRRDAHPLDANRGLSTLDQVITAYEKNWTVETAPIPHGHGRGGHYWVFDIGLFCRVVHYSNLANGTRFNVVTTEEFDSKVGNGHTIVLKKELYNASHSDG